MTRLFAFASSLDAATFLALPAGAEANPFVAAMPPLLAVTLKAVMVAAVLRLPFGRYRVLVLAVGVAVGCVGAGFNVAVLV